MDLVTGMSGGAVWRFIKDFFFLLYSCLGSTTLWCCSSRNRESLKKLFRQCRETKKVKSWEKNLMETCNHKIELEKWDERGVNRRRHDEQPTTCKFDAKMSSVQWRRQHDVFSFWAWLGYFWSPNELENDP